MKRLAVGTKNPAKVHAAQDVLIGEELNIISVQASSHVSVQPFSDEETREGAVNRAKGAIELGKAHFGLGLEGGVYQQSGELYLCNWGALITDNGDQYVAAGLRLPLPAEIAEQLYSGLELSVALKKWHPEGSKQSGAVGYLTGGMISRKTMFAEVVKSCYGQYKAAKMDIH